MKRKVHRATGALGAAMLVMAISAVAQAKGPVHTSVAVSPLFGNQMVLQRNAPDPVWGTAAPGEPVTVSINGQHEKTVANAKGKWMVKLAPMKATFKPLTLKIAGASNTITITDVLVGKVWLASGQSNMAFTLASNSPKYTAPADSSLRFFNVPFCSARHPKHGFKAGWRNSWAWTNSETRPPHRASAPKVGWHRCTAKTALHFSAVAYFFGQYLRHKLRVPVGIIDNAVSGSVADTWTSLEAMRGIPRLKPIIDRYASIVKGYPAAQQRYKAALARWRATGKAAGQKRPKREYVAYTPYYWEHPGHLYNGMLVPLAPYRIRGVIWYQGEFNADRAWQYRKLLPAMIKNWRTLWGQGDFPFFIVELPGFLRPAALPADKSWSHSNWAELREAQAHVARIVPDSGLVVTIDTVNPKFGDLHPPHKRPVGQRLALLALAKVYHRKVVYSGPVFKKMQIQGHNLRLLFRHVDGGLTSHGKPIIGFAVAGRNKKFYWATAHIAGHTVIVSSTQVPHPVAVRYAWGTMPQWSLFNEGGLPMAPFRTDHWTEWTKKSLQHE